MGGVQDIRRRLSAGHWRPTPTRLRQRGHAAITIDDGPSPKTTPRLLELLRDYRATASFFVSGNRAEQFPDLLDAIASAGHGLYSHGYSHCRMDELPAGKLISELERTERLLSRHRTAPAPYLLRLPYSSGHRSARVHQEIGRWQHTYQLVHWNVSMRDWTLADGCRSIANVRANCRSIVDQVADAGQLPGSIILMHEDPFDTPAELSSEVAPLLMETILKKMKSINIDSAGLENAGMSRPFSRYFQAEKLL